MHVRWLVLLSLAAVSSCKIILKMHRVHDHIPAFQDPATREHILSDHKKDFARFLEERMEYTAHTLARSPTRPENVEITDFWTVRHKTFIELGQITVTARQPWEEEELLIEFMKLKAAEVGANAVINFSRETTQPGEPANLKRVRGTAIAFTD
jgi:hypothetical protein